MESVDDFLEELEAGGRLEAAGAFTLDRAKAREKMRQFQLSDPHRYVLLLVSAAAELGASQIAFRIDTDDMEARFDGEAFTRHDFDELYVSMFGARHDPKVRARQDLALALNAAMALNPRWVEVCSRGPDGRGVKITMRPNAEDEVEALAATDGTPAGTHVHVKDRFRPGLLLKFVDSVRGRLAEELLIKDLCRHASWPIVLGGTQVGRGLALPDCWGVVEEQDDGLRLIAGFERAGNPARLLIAVHGVLLATHALPEAPRGLVVMADSGRLRRDVSQQDVVRDEAYAALLERVVQIQRRSQLAFVAEVGPKVEGVAHVPDPPLRARATDDEARGGAEDPPDGGDTEAADADDVIVALAPLAQGPSTALVPVSEPEVPAWVPHMLLASLEVAARGDHAEDTEDTAGTAALLAALKTVRLWRTVAGDIVATDAVVAQAGRVAFTQHLVRHFDVEAHGPMVYAPTRAARAALRRVFGKRAVDRTRTLVREARHERNRARWRARPRPPELGYGTFIARAPIRSDLVQVAGEVGVKDVGTTEATLAVIVDGCVLFDANPAGALPGLSIVVEAPLKPNAAYEGVRRTPDMDHLVAAILSAIGEMMTRLVVAAGPGAASPDRQMLLMTYLWRLESGELARGLFAAFGVKQRSLSRRIRRAAGDGPRPVWAPDWRLSAPEPHPIARVPLFEQLGRRPAATLVEIARGLHKHGRIAVVDRQTQQLQPPEPVLFVGQTRRGVLALLFGEAAVVDVRDEVVAWRFRAEHDAKPVLPLSLTQPLRVGPVTTQRDAATVVVGLAAAPGPTAADAAADIDVRLASRHLVRVRAACAVEGIVAIVDDDTLPADRDYSGLDSDEARQAVVATVMRATAEMLCAHADASTASGTPDAAVVVAMLRAAFPGPTWHRALRVLIDERGPDKGEAAYRELLALRHQTPGREVTRRVMDQLALGHINVAAIRRSLADDDAPRDSAQPIPSALLRSGVAARVSLLRSLAIFARADGGRASLDDLWARYDESGWVCWLADEGVDPGPVDTGGELIVRVDESALAGLRGLFPAAVVLEASGLLADLARQRQLAQRPPLSSLALETSMALVQLPIDSQDFEGSVGLRRAAPEEGGARVLACRQRRSLGWTALEIPTSMVAIVSADDLGRTSDELDASERETVGALCMRYEAALIGRLLDGLAGMNAGDVALARAWIRWLLAHRGEALRSRHASLAQRLAEVPVFPQLGGTPLSWDDLQAARAAHGRTRAALQDASGPVQCDEPVLDLTDPATREVVLTLLQDVADHEGLLAAERHYAERMDDAPVLPAVPAEAWVHAPVRGGGLEGQLWLVADDLRGNGVRLGVEGRVVAICGAVQGQPLPGLLPCAGAVQGEGIEFDQEAWAASLTPLAQQALRVASERLYLALMQRFESGETDGALRRTPMRTRLAAAARLLTHERLRAGKLKGARGALLSKLAKLPLFGLASGRYVSVDDARQARPLELAHLGLWASLDVETDALDRLSAIRDTTLVATPPTDRAAILEPEPAPAPEPPPPPTVQTPEQRWLEAIRSELRLVRQRNRALLTDAHLDSVRFAAHSGASITGADGLVSIDSAHEVVARLLATPGEPDPVSVSFVASAVYTALNHRLGEVTDADEAAFIVAHAEHVATAVDDERSPT